MVSCDQFPEDIEKEEIVILAPKENDIIQSSEVLFWWEDLDGTDQYRFQLVRPNFNDTRELLSDTLLIEIDTLNQEANKIKVFLEPGTYQWRVRGENFGYQTDFKVQSLTIQ